MISGLFWLEAGALFIFIYTILDLLEKKYKTLKKFSLAKRLDNYVVNILYENSRTRNISAKIQKMLKSSSLRIKGEPLFMVHFIIISSIFAITALFITNMLLNNIMAAFILTAAAGMLPYILLKFDYKRNRKKIRKQASNFLLAVSNLFHVYGDPVIALEKLSPKLNNPLKREINWFINSIKFGIPLSQCIETVKLRIPDKILRNFFDDTYFFLRNGGNFQESIINLTESVYNRETAEIEQKTETSSTVLIFFVMVGIYFMMLFALTKTQPEIINLLIATKPGKLIVVLMICIFVIAGFLTYKMSSIGVDD